MHDFGWENGFLRLQIYKKAIFTINKGNVSSICIFLTVRHNNLSGTLVNYASFFHF